MSQVTDYTIANDTGANVRSDINAVLSAIQTLNSGSSDPSANVAFQLSVNTTTSLLKIRNAANNGYVTIGNVTQTNLGLAQLEADLRAQGLQQAQAQQAQAISQFGALSGLEQAQATQNLALLGQAGGVQSGLASLQPQLVAGSIGDLSTVGQQSQALNQAVLDAQAAANREAAYETQQRLGFFGSQISPLMGAYGAQTQFATTQQTPPSTLQTILGTGLGLAGIARAFG